MTYICTWLARHRKVLSDHVALKKRTMSYCICTLQHTKGFKKDRFDRRSRCWRLDKNVWFSKIYYFLLFKKKIIIINYPDMNRILDRHNNSYQSEETIVLEYECFLRFLKRKLSKKLTWNQSETVTWIISSVKVRHTGQTFSAVTHCCCKKASWHNHEGWWKDPGGLKP